MVAEAENLEQQLEARDPDVRLMIQVRTGIAGAFETSGREVPESADGDLVPSGWQSRGGRRPLPGSIPSHLQGEEGLSPSRQVFHLAFHHCKQPGAESFTEQGP